MKFRLFFCAHRHECASGYYRVSAYFLAKVCCDILPMRVLPIVLFSAVTYWMIGSYHFCIFHYHTFFHPCIFYINNFSPNIFLHIAGFRKDGIKFLIYMLNLVLTSLSAAAVCFAVSSSVKIFALASLLTVLPYIFMMVRSAYSHLSLFSSSSSIKYCNVDSFSSYPPRITFITLGLVTTLPL